LHIDETNMLTGFFQDSDFIVVLQIGFGSGFLPLGWGLESDSKKLESEHLWTKHNDKIGQVVGRLVKYLRYWGQCEG